MAASKLIPPAQWPGMTYLEILNMIWEMTLERTCVSSPDRNTHLSSGGETYMYMLRDITFNIKKMLSRTRCGFWNPVFDPFAQAFPPTFVTNDMTWKMADVLTEIGDATFYDFSDAISPSTLVPPVPLFGNTEDYRSVEYLEQYYNILLLLKKPLVDWAQSKEAGEFYHTNFDFPGEANVGGSAGRSARHLDLRSYGMALQNQIWPADQAAHDAEYADIYKYPPSGNANLDIGPAGQNIDKLTTT